MLFKCADYKQSQINSFKCKKDKIAKCYLIANKDFDGCKESYEENWIYIVEFIVDTNFTPDTINVLKSQFDANINVR